MHSYIKLISCTQDFVFVHNQLIYKHYVLHASSIRTMISYSQCNEAKVFKIHKIMKEARASTHQLRNVMASSPPSPPQPQHHHNTRLLSISFFDFFLKIRSNSSSISIEQIEKQRVNKKNCNVTLDLTHSTEEGMLHQE